MSGGTRLVADAVLPCDGSGAVHRPGAVDIGPDGRIARVGPVAAPAGSTDDSGEWTVKWVGGLLMPGLVNAHCHSPMTLLRGQGEGLPLDRWLREVIWPREARVGGDDVFWGMSLAAAELLRYGVTTTVEMYFHDDRLAEAVDAAGSRCVITPAVVVAPGWERFGTWPERIEWIAGLRSRYSAHPRIEVGFGPHSAYALPDEAIAAVGEAARSLGAPVHIHVAESEHEGDEVSARHGGATVPQVLSDLGLFDVDRVLAAHAVWLTAKDVDLLASDGVAVAHCPGSNAKLASGTAGLTALLRAGIPVGLGTDGPASNNDLDLWEEMRLAALLARQRERDPTVLPAAEVLGLATVGGAAALGRSDIGALQPGRWADIVRLDLDDPGFVPVLSDGDLAAHAVWSASRAAVRDVWVAGRQVVADGECTTVDVAEARRRVQAAAEALAR
ncbi:MAG: S-adenosylhomocysteine deaminase; Methylthioadenosine deaminase [uncultured Corynebacteriales bacterium]|uniref:S-adenosylhomocysteine deaminase Methylthioadenosine deaminase n=1 Tax=uncultured Mycobacteriales bacterium TaxID=581187 RepID=A0A6J4H7X3_9ACTN|nr:MAG: S-adenosylhomocysteine deaminase; Methylthioadenosine deaminase [uncultured Corynebacteriales bacterium]